MKLPLWLSLLLHPITSRLIVSDFDAYDAGLGACEWHRRWRFLRIGYGDDDDGDAGVSRIERRTVLLLGDIEVQMEEFDRGWCK